MASCIGTDVLDDVIVAETLTISQESVILQIGETESISANYTNQYGIDEDVSLMWNTTDGSVASVNDQGIVTALARGQVNVTASYNSVMSDPVMVTIVEDINDVAEVRISAPMSMLVIGESIQLSVAAFNVLEEEISTADVVWSVSDETVATITQTGLLTGVSDGEVEVTATIDGVQSLSLTVTVGSDIRTATFSGANGYNSSGTAMLFADEGGDIILELSDDFSADFALGTFIYLANSTSGSEVRGGGLELREITSGGAHTFNVTEIDASVDLDTYRYVIVLCKPAAITFGLADFNE